LLNVGFLYLSETGLPEQLVKDVIGECQSFFQKLPQEEKERIEMKNEKSFLGWSRVSRRLLNVWFVSICLVVSVFCSIIVSKKVAVISKKSSITNYRYAIIYSAKPDAGDASAVAGKRDGNTTLPRTPEKATGYLPCFREQK
jgi:isopenicillin N synthase-like dioxygenase